MGEEPQEPYTVEVEGVLGDDGVFTVRARLRYENGGQPEPHTPLFAAASLALMEAIAEESQRGRRLGARKLVLQLDAPGETSTVDLGDRFPDPAMLD